MRSGTRACAHISDNLSSVYLTPTEQRLVAAIAEGTLVDFVPELRSEDVDFEVMRFWPEDNHIRSIVITDILRGRYLSADGLSPRALRLRGAVITGRVDLNGIKSSIRLELLSCYLPDGLDGHECVIPRLVLNGSVITAPDGEEDYGAVHLIGAQIAGEFSMTDATVISENGPALRADSMIIDGDVSLDGSFNARGYGSRGAVCFPAARITGELYMTGATLVNDAGPALYVNRISVGNSAFLDAGFTGRGHGDLGAVSLLGAKVTGQLVMRGAKLSNGTGPALVADGLIVDGDAVLNDQFTAHGDGDGGAVRLVGARVTGQLNMRDSSLFNDAGPAIHADGAVVGEDALFDHSFSAHGRSELATVSLIGVHIAGQLLMSGATLLNNDGYALAADGIAVDGDAFLDETFNASGDSEQGTVSLAGAHISGQLVMTDATLVNRSGPALLADGIALGGDVFLNGKFDASGLGDQGAVSLVGARVGGQFVLTDATLRNETGPALHCDRMTVGDDAQFLGSFTASGRGVLGTVRLRGCHITGSLAINTSSMRNARNGATWVVDGLTYDLYPSVGFKEWLGLLRRGTPEYRPQPYRQLAAAAKSAGHDSDARRALMAQRDDQVYRGGMTRRAKLWARFTKLTLGYGYQPWRALVGVALVLAGAIIMVFIPGVLEHVLASGSPASGIITACTPSESLQFAVDMAIPLVSTSGDSCQFASTSQGEISAGTSVGIALAGWALTALFAAGFTRAVREP